MVTVIEARVCAKEKASPLASKERFERWFEKAAEVLRALDIPVDWTLDNAGHGAHNYIGSEWFNIRKEFMGLDYSILTRKEHLKLNRCLEHDLPRYLDVYAKKIVTKDHLRAWKWHDVTWKSEFRSVPQQIAKRQAQNAHQRRYESVLTLTAEKTGLVSKQKALPAVTPATLTRGQIDFSALNAIRAFDAALGDTAHALLSDWKRASDRSTSVEDRYRLEQIVKEHIPELVRILPGVSEASKPEAISLIREQLLLLHVQVKQVLEQHEVDSMTALRAQTSFIRTLAESNAPTRLVLESAANEQIEGA